MPKVTIRQEKCKGCGLCSTVCPKKIIFLSDEKINEKGFHPAEILEMEKCIGCQFCATICPDCVIKIEK